MVGWETSLSPKKIAAVASFIRQEWGNKGGEISEAKVLAAKKEFAGKTGQWTEAELAAFANENLPDADGANAPAAPAAPAAATPAAAPRLLLLRLPRLRALMAPSSSPRARCNT